MESKREREAGMSEQRNHASWIGYYERLGAEDAAEGEPLAPWLIAFGHKDYEDAYVRGYEGASSRHSPSLSR
jgi:hypothetical protein